MTRPARPAVHAALAAILMGLLLAPVQAQEAAQAPAAEQAPAGNLDQRVRNIEEQLLEIQTLLGTLQSLVRSGGGAAPAPGGVSAGGLPGDGGDSDQRLRVMETQINALSRQVEQLTGQLSHLGVSGSDQPSSGQPAPQFGTVTVPPEPQQQQQLPQFPPLAQQPQSPQPQAPQPQGGQLAPDLRGGDSGLGQLGAQPQSPAPAQTAALSPEQARVLYDQAYGNLVRRDFAAAEQGFRQFLTSFPSDQLSGNAQYWLGETYFLRNQYKQAADNFLKAYQRYPTGSKAPESLLRLGTSLAQLGNKEDACSTIAEVSRKFPDAPDYLKQRAATESRRAGC